MIKVLITIQIVNKLRTSWYKQIDDRVVIIYLSNYTTFIILISWMRLEAFPPESVVSVS
jgi:hypothetical protein